MVIVLVLVTSTLLLGSVLLPNTRGAVHFVGGAGPGNYTTIQQAIFAAGTGDTVYVFNGTYFENVEIYKPLNLVGESRVGTIIDGNGTGDVIYVTYDFVNISNIAVTNTGAGAWNDIGIHIFGAQHCSVSGNNISMVGYGVYLDRANNNSITGNGFYSIMREGVNITLADSNTVSDNIFFWVGWMGVGLHSADRNILSHNSHSSYLTTYGIHLEHSHHNVIGDATVSEHSSAIRLENSDYNTIHNSTLSLNDHGGIDLLSSSSNSIRDNEVRSNDYGVGIYSRFSTDNMVLDNVVASNTRGGVSLSYSDNGNVVAGNAVSGSGWGISLYYADNNEIRNNDVFNNTEGLYLQNATGNILRGNNVSHNTMRGIYIDGSTTNSFAYNNVSENGVGFYTYSSSSNWIYHNNIMDNLDQAFNSDNTNEWDFGYSRGGNYWSDYVGVDVNMGPNQDVPGSDGIGDTPRPVDMGNEDRYPLMTPSPPPQGPPSPPRNLQANAGTDVVTLTWDRPAFNGRSPIRRYNIYRGTTSGGEMYLDYVVTQLTYKDANVSKCQTYFYQVTAENDIGESVRSNEVNATVWAGLRGPADVDAFLSGGSFEDVIITWTLSPDDGAGCGFVVRYEVHRGVSYDSEGGGYQFAGFVVNGTSFFVDSLAGDGNLDNYFYRICAVSSFNDTNCSVGQAAKFTRPLSPGPSLLSIPLIQSNESIQHVLRTVEYDKAWYYDSSSQEWKWYMEDKTYSGGLSGLNHTMGMWVNATQDCNLTVAGVVPAQATIHLIQGWNLVSFLSFNATYTVADLKAETGATRVEGFDPVPPYFLRVLGDAEVLQAGYGYWVRVEADTVWIVSFS